MREGCFAGGACATGYRKGVLRGEEAEPRGSTKLPMGAWTAAGPPRARAHDSLLKSSLAEAARARDAASLRGALWLESHAVWARVSGRCSGDQDADGLCSNAVPPRDECLQQKGAGRRSAAAWAHTTRLNTACRAPTDKAPIYRAEGPCAQRLRAGPPAHSACAGATRRVGGNGARRKGAGSRAGAACRVQGRCGHSVSIQVARQRRAQSMAATTCQ